MEPLALAASLYAVINSDYAQELLDRLRGATDPSWWQCFSSMATAVWDTLVYPARLARSYTWATEKGLCERLARFPNCQVRHNRRTPILLGTGRPRLSNLKYEWR